MKLLSTVARPSRAALLSNNSVIVQSYYGNNTAFPAHDVLISCDGTKNKADYVLTSEEAWIYAALSRAQPEVAAIICSTPEGCSIGSYEHGKIRITARFAYPNSLELFLAAAMRFVNAANIDEFLAQASRGNPIYSTAIAKHILTQPDHGSYVLTVDATRGFGSYAPNPDIAASTQQIYEETLSSLAYYITTRTNTTNLILTGSVVDNASAVTRLSKNYSLFMPPSGNPDIRTLGGLVKHSKVICSTLATGGEQGDSYEPDNLARSIIREPSRPISQSHGRVNFANKRLGERSLIFIPFTAISSKFAQFLPLYACQEQDYKKYFEGNSKDVWAQYLHKSKVPSLADGRVIITNTANHFYLNRVLQITRESNYPILQIA